MEQGLEAKTSKVSRAVLLLTGALNPVHVGHVQCLQHAKAALEKEGVTVCGGFLSPSHDSYVRPKMKRSSSKCYSPEQRVAMCRLATQGSDWLETGDSPLSALHGAHSILHSPLTTHCNLCVPAHTYAIAAGTWESSPERKHWPDFPEVCKSLQQALADRAATRDIRVFFVCGMDHFVKCHLSSGMRGGVGLVVLPRKGKHARTNWRHKVVAVTTTPPTVSSTLIRTLLKRAAAAADGEADNRPAIANLQELLHPAVAKFLMAKSSRVASSRETADGGGGKGEQEQVAGRAAEHPGPALEWAAEESTQEKGKPPEPSPVNRAGRPA